MGGIVERLQIRICFFFIYVFLLFGVLIPYLNPRKNISQQLQSLDYGSSIIILLTILSLGGIPPLLGFLGKIIIRTNKIKRFSFLKRFFCFSFFGFTILVCFFI